MGESQLSIIHHRDDAIHGRAKVAVLILNPAVRAGSRGTAAAAIVSDINQRVGLVESVDVKPRGSAAQAHAAEMTFR